MNIPIDIGIISIPYMIITKTKLKPHERIIIFLVFAAQGMGTIVRCVSANPHPVLSMT